MNNGVWDKEDLFKHMEEATAKMLDICRKKNADYTGIGKSPFSNFSRVENLGICSTEQGVLTRITDKISRLASYSQNLQLQVADESVEDTCLDLANYALLLQGIIKEKKAIAEYNRLKSNGTNNFV